MGRGGRRNPFDFLGGCGGQSQRRFYRKKSQFEQAEKILDRSGL